MAPFQRKTECRPSFPNKFYLHSSLQSTFSQPFVVHISGCLTNFNRIFLLFAWMKFFAETQFSVMQTMFYCVISHCEFNGNILIYLRSVHVCVSVRLCFSERGGGGILNLEDRALIYYPSTSLLCHQQFILEFPTFWW